MERNFNGVAELLTITNGLDSAELRNVEVGQSRTPEYVGIWNTTRDMLETIVKRKNSMLVQHKDAFAALSRSLQGKNLNPRGVVKDFGGKVITEMTFDNVTIKSLDDEVKIGLRVVNNYSRGAMDGQGFGVRDVCDNGMFLKGATNTLFLKHSTIEKVEKAIIEFIDNVLKNKEKVEKIISIAKSEIFTSINDAREVALAGLKSKRKARKIIDLLEDKDKISRYTLYNSLTYYATHLSNNESERQKIQTVAQKVLIKNMAKLKKAEWED